VWDAVACTEQVGIQPTLSSCFWKGPGVGSRCVTKFRLTGSEWKFIHPHQKQLERASIQSRGSLVVRARRNKWKSIHPSQKRLGRAHSTQGVRLGFRLAEASGCSSTLSRNSWKGPAHILEVGPVSQGLLDQVEIHPPFPEMAGKSP